MTCQSSDLLTLVYLAGALLAIQVGELLILGAWRAAEALRLLIAAYAPAQVACRRLRAKIRRMRRALARGGAAGGR